MIPHTGASIPTPPPQLSRPNMTACIITKRSGHSRCGSTPDPLDEAVSIILSFQTDLARFKTTWLRLRTAYSSWEAVEHAPTRDVARVLREGGLHKQKARTIRRLLCSVREVAGELSLD